MPNLRYFGEFLADIQQFIDMIIPIMIGIALIFFFWGLVQYVRKPEAAEGRKIMIGGLIALFIMVSVWGIIALTQNVLGIQSNDEAQGEIDAPNVPR